MDYLITVLAIKKQDTAPLVSENASSGAASYTDPRLQGMTKLLLTVLSSINAFTLIRQESFAQISAQLGKHSLTPTIRKPSDELFSAGVSPLAAGRWHGPAKVICQEGQSIVWVAHGTTILRCAPENLRQETPMPSEVPAPSSVDVSLIPVPDSEDGLCSESILLASETVLEPEPEMPELLSFTTLEAAEFAEGPPLAEDNLPYVHVRVKDLSREEVALFDQAKQKELQCRATVLQTIASCKFPLSSFDIKTAFLRGKADEGNPLAMEPPPELRKLLNLHEDEVCQLVGNAYGRVDAPLLFYKELCKQLGKLGFEPHPLEPCVFVLKTGSRLRGILGVHVDDGVCGGDAYFHQKVEELQRVLPFGSRKHQNVVFTGIQLEQFPDHSIRASQSDYVHRIPSIDIGRPRRQDLDAPVNEDERTKLRGLIGSLQYAVTHTRPDVAARLGEVQCQTTTATVQTLLLANKVLREAQEHHRVSIVFQAIPVEQLTFVAFGDASFASSKNLISHQGVLICATDGRLNQNREAPVSPLTWSSKKIPRVVRSTLSAEAYAMSKAVDLLGCVRVLWGVIHITDFKWQQPELGFKQLHTAVIVTDCKSLYDLVTRLAMPACEEYRTTLEVLLIKQRCLENACFR
ncbi:RE1 [Symbiodinium sp. CCMP2592]|nr:RE1 [Symbiodinium sp. CCMP2592]